MSLGFRGGANAAVTNELLGYPAASSIYGKCIPVVYGVKRIGGNLIQAFNWQALDRSQKGKNSKSGSNNYDYRAFIVIALCQGPISNLGELWYNNVTYGLKATGGGVPGSGGSAFVIPADGSAFVPPAPIDAQLAIDMGAYQVWAYNVGTQDYGAPPGVLIGQHAQVFSAVSGQSVNNIYVTNKGQGYSVAQPPNVKISGGGGTGAQAGVVLEPDPDNQGWYRVADVVVTQGGSGYTSAPMVTIDPPPSGSQSRTTAVAVAALGPPLYIDAGQYYFDPATASYRFSPADAGTTVWITYEWNQVSALSGTTPAPALGFELVTGELGQEYWSGFADGNVTLSQQLALNYSTVAFVGAGPFDLGSTGTLSNISFEIFGLGIWFGGIYDAPPLMPAPVATRVNLSGGSVSSAEVLWSPSCYLTNPLPVVLFTGDGSGATGTAVVDGNASSPTYGQVTGVTVNTGGSGYTWAACFVGFVGRQDYYEKNSSGKIVPADPVHTQQLPFLQTALGGIIIDLLANPLWGVGGDQGFLPFEIGDTTDMATYAISHTLFFSLALESQDSCVSVVRKLLKASNSESFWSEGVLKFRTYGDTTAIGNGYMFTPQTAPIYDLDVDNYLGQGTDDPLLVERKSVRDRPNRWKIEWENRLNNYNTEPLVEDDEWAIAQFGLNAASEEKMEFLTTHSAAQQVVNLMKLNAIYKPNIYKFKMGLEAELLEPMDLVTVTDPYLGWVYNPVRILSIKENDNMEFEFECEDFPWGTQKPTLHAKNVAATFGPGYYANPGFTFAPVFVELPEQITQGNPYVLGIGVSGSLNWGGCQVYVSTDGGNSYKFLGMQWGPGTIGSLTAPLPDAPDPDNTNTLSVNVGESFGALQNYTQAEKNAFVSLCGIDDELLSYETATLTGQHAYDLKNLRRAVYNSIPGAHAAGAPFVMVDAQLFQWTYTQAEIGTTVWFKFPAVNTYGQRPQSLSQVLPYGYFVIGPRLPYPWNTRGAIWHGDAAVAAIPNWPTWPRFSIEQEYWILADASQLAYFKIIGFQPVNVFSTATLPPPAIDPVPVSTGGNLAGGATYIIGISAIDPGGLYTPLSLASVVVPPGTNTNSINVSVEFNNPATDSGVAFVTLDPDLGWSPAATLAVGVNTFTITDLGNMHATDAPPDQDFNSFDLYATILWHNGIWAGQINAIQSNGDGTCTLTFNLSNWATNQLQGRVMSLMGCIDQRVQAILDAKIQSNITDMSSGQPIAYVTLTQDYTAPGVTQLQVGDVMTIRTQATTYTQTSIGDALFINGGSGQKGTGLDPDAEKGRYVFLIGGTGAFQAPVQIASNDATTLQTVTPFEVTPGPDSTFIIIDSSVKYQQQSGGMRASAPLQAIELDFPVDNSIGQSFFVQVYATNLGKQSILTKKTNAALPKGQMSLMQATPFREIYQPGWGLSERQSTPASRLAAGTPGADVLTPLDEALDVDTTDGDVDVFLQDLAYYTGSTRMVKKITNDTPVQHVVRVHAIQGQTIEGLTYQQLSEPGDSIGITPY